MRRRIVECVPNFLRRAKPGHCRRNRRRNRARPRRRHSWKNDGRRSQSIGDHIRGITCSGRRGGRACSREGSGKDRSEGTYGRTPAHWRYRCSAVRTCGRRHDGRVRRSCAHVGEEIWRRLGVPVYFYEQAAHAGPSGGVWSISVVGNSKRRALSPQPTPTGGPMWADRNCTPAREPQSWGRARS